MGKLITPQHWTPRPTRRPVPRDAWGPAPAEIIEPTYQRTGWAPPGTIALAAAAAYLDTTVDLLIPHLIRRDIPVLAEQDGIFFLDLGFVERMRECLDRQLALAESR